MATHAAIRGGSRKGDFLAGKYLLEECLGVGGMGEVYRATNMSLGRKVAIKLLSRDFVDNEGDVLRFLREARAAAAVRHPNVIDVLDVSRDDDGTPFIVQELLSGQDLERHLKASGGRLGVAEILEIMIPVADAIGTAHDQGLVHRDLKPANVFLSREGGYLRPKVLDFGACLYETVGQLSEEEQRMLIGTPHYMAPEQITTKCDVDARADVWALGVMMYELFLGETPFEAATASEVMRLVRTRPAPPLRSRDPSAPRELERVVSQCLALDKHARYEDGAALRSALIETRSALRPSSRIGTVPDLEPEAAPASARAVSIAAKVATTPVSSERLLSPPADSFPELELGAAPRSAPPAARRSSIPPVLDPGMARAAEAPPLTPPLTPPIAPRRASAAQPKLDAADEERRPPWPRDSKLRFAAVVVGPAVGLFGLLRVASFVTAPLGRAMRGDSVVASGVLAVASLVVAAAVAAKSLSSRSRGALAASASSFALGIAMIIVTFAASETADLGVSPAAAAIVPCIAPLVPLGLAVDAFGRARDVWLLPYERRRARALVALTSLLLCAALELSPFGAVRTGSQPTPQASAAAPL